MRAEDSADAEEENKLLTEQLESFVEQIAALRKDRDMLRRKLADAGHQVPGFAPSPMCTPMKPSSELLDSESTTPSQPEEAHLMKAIQNGTFHMESLREMQRNLESLNAAKAGGEYKVLTQNKTIILVSKPAITFISHRYQKTFSRIRKCHVAAFTYLNKLVDCCAKVNLYGLNIFGFLIFPLISVLAGHRARRAGARQAGALSPARCSATRAGCNTRQAGRGGG